MENNSYYQNRIYLENLNNHNMNNVPQCHGIPLGTLEVFGKKFDRRQFVLNNIETVFRKFGFDPLSTPVLEYAKVFDGHHGEGEELFFKLKDSKENELMLRYDLTVPLARYISDNSTVPLPFKRYQIATVFRDDEVDKGHFREFTQCDGDIIGVSDLAVDAEIVSMAHAGLNKVGLRDHVININHRKILNAFAEKASYTTLEDRQKIQRTLDAISKYSEKLGDEFDSNSALYIQELSTIFSRYKLSDKACEVIKDMLAISGSYNEMLDAANELLRDYPDGKNGVSELKEIFSYLSKDTQDVVKIDFSLARGADYYTGFILEGSVPNVQVGAILGGGRFDDLVKRLNGPDLPAVGMAFGLDRILTVLDELDLFSYMEVKPRMLVAPIVSKNVAALLNYARKLRNNGVQTDFIPLIDYSHEDVYAYAAQRGFTSFVVSDGDNIVVKPVYALSSLNLSDFMAVDSMSTV